jgi:hypothetical protein
MDKRMVVLLFLLFLPINKAFSAALSYRGAASFNLAVYKPDFTPINDELLGIGMPRLDKPMLLYGGQILLQFSDHLRGGLMGFTGASSVEDMENGYARKAGFNLWWGGAVVEVVIYGISRFETYLGASLGGGSATICLEKTHNPANWGEIWGNYSAAPGDSNSTDNLTTIMHHPFFLAQPRLGLRYYANNWLAFSGSVEIPLVHLSSGGWKMNGNDLFGAPGMNLMRPFYQFSIYIGT